MKRPGSHWAAANAALLAARGMQDLPAEEASALLALLHAGTLVDLPDAAALRALDERRLEWARQLADPTLEPVGAQRAAIGLLTLGHRAAARTLRAVSPSPMLDAAWAAWVGEVDSLQQQRSPIPGTARSLAGDSMFPDPLRSIRRTRLRGK